MPKQENAKSIGALWRKKSKKGTNYFNGNIKLGKDVVKLVVFKNNYKEEEKQPDYLIYVSEEQGGGGSRYPNRAPARASRSRDEDDELNEQAEQHIRKTATVPDDDFND